MRAANLTNFELYPFDEGSIEFLSQRDIAISRRNIIADIIITSLVIAAGLAFVIAPVSIFLGIPALLTTYGLAGMSTWSLALVAAGVTFAVTSVLYGESSNLDDVWGNAKVSSAAKAPVAAADNSQAKSATETTCRMRSHAGRPTLETDPIGPSRESCGGFFSNLTGCLVGICGGSNHTPTRDSDESESLTTTFGADNSTIIY